MEPVQHRRLTPPIVSYESKTWDARPVTSAAESFFSKIHQIRASVFSIPLFLLRKDLVCSEEIIDEGSLSSWSQLQSFHGSSLRKDRINEWLQHTFSLSLFKTRMTFTLKEFARTFVKMYPHLELHGIGSSLPIDPLWAASNINKMELDKNTQFLMIQCSEMMDTHHHDVDIRIMGEEGAEAFLKVLAALCKEKLPERSITPNMIACAIPPPFRPDEKTTVMTFSNDEGTTAIDFIFCNASSPSFLATIDAPYISLNEFFKTKKAPLHFCHGVIFSEFLIHKLAKIYRVPDANKINSGGFKRLIQKQTYGYITPQKGLVDKIVASYLNEKPRSKQFYSIFNERKEHLIQDPKTEMTFCLNLISCIEEFFPPEDKIRFWKECAKLITKEQSKLLMDIAYYIKKYPHGGGELITLLKICSLMTFTSYKLKKKGSAINSLPPVYASVQNGEPYLALPVNAQNTVHLKLDPKKTLSDLIDYFDFARNHHEISLARKKDLTEILLEFTKRLLVVELAENATPHDMKDLIHLGMNPHDIEQRLTPHEFSEDPSLHLLNLIWKVFSQICDSDLPFYEQSAITSLVPALDLLHDQKEQMVFLDKLENLSFHHPKVFSKIVKRMKEKLLNDRNLSFSEGLEILFQIMGQEGGETCHQGYLLWVEAAQESRFREEEKCRSLFALLAHLSPKILNKRLNAQLENKSVSPLEIYRSLTPEIALSQTVIFQLLNRLVENHHYSESKALMEKLEKGKNKKMLMPIANRILNHYIAQKKPDEAIECYRFLKSFGLEKDKFLKDWKFIQSLFRNRQPTKSIIYLVIQFFNQLKEEIPVLNPKIAGQMASILDRSFQHMSFEEKLSCLTSLHDFNRQADFEPLTSCEIKLRKSLVYSSLPSQKFAIAKAYGSHYSWKIAAEVLTTIPNHWNENPKILKDFFDFCLRTLNQLNVTDESQLLLSWKLLLICQNSLNHDLLLAKTEMLFRQLKEHPNIHPEINDWNQKLSQLIAAMRDSTPFLGSKMLLFFCRLGIEFKKKKCLLQFSDEDSLDMAWNIYQSLTSSLKPDQFKDSKIAYLRQLSLKAKKHDYHSVIIPEILNMWRALAAPCKMPKEWMEVIQWDIHNQMMKGQIKMAFTQLKLFIKCSKNHNEIRSFLQKSFKEFYAVYCQHSHSDFNPHVLIEMWKKYSTKFFKNDDIRNSILDIYLQEGMLPEAWGIQLKSESLIHEEAFQSLDAIVDRIHCESRWNRLFKTSKIAKGLYFKNEVHNIFFKLICRDICPVQKNLSDRDVVQKVLKWQAVPPDFNQIKDSQENPEEFLKLYLKTRTSVIDALVIGIWGLTRKKVIKISDALERRLHIIGAILWLKVGKETRMPQGTPDFQMTFHLILNEFRPLILEELKGDPCFNQYEDLVIDSSNEVRLSFNIRRNAWAYAIVCTFVLMIYIYQDFLFKCREK